MRAFGSRLPSLLAAALSFATTARANFMPESAVFVHVQPVQTDFCTSNPITDCGQISQLTFDTGELEFDILLWAPEPLPLSACDLQLSWPAAWQYRGGELCNDGWGSITPGSSGATLHAEWWWGPVMENDVTLIARITMGVEGYGALSTDAGPGTVTWGNPPETIPIDWRTRATAGIICAYCYHSCPGSGICSPTLQPTTLLFEVPPGGTGQQMIEAGVYPPSGPTPSFEEFAPWMSLAVAHPGPWPDYWQLTVTVDAAGLDPGEYEGWVTATCGCRACTHVTLTVLPTSSVTDERGGAHLDSTRTWGGVKALFQ